MVDWRRGGHVIVGVIASLLVFLLCSVPLAILPETRLGRPPGAPSAGDVLVLLGGSTVLLVLFPCHRWSAVRSPQSSRVVSGRTGAGWGYSPGSRGS